MIQTDRISVTSSMCVCVTCLCGRRLRFCLRVRLTATHSGVRRGGAAALLTAAHDAPASLCLSLCLSKRDRQRAERAKSVSHATSTALSRTLSLLSIELPLSLYAVRQSPTAVRWRSIFFVLSAPLSAPLSVPLSAPLAVSLLAPSAEPTSRRRLLLRSFKLCATPASGPPPSDWTVNGDAPPDVGRRYFEMSAPPT